MAPGLCCDVGANVANVARSKSRIGKFEDDVRAREHPHEHDIILSK